jgi:Spy/CpxP family protein refolding chaperone
MRMLGKWALTLGVVALMASPALAQGRRGGRGPGGQGGGFGGLLGLLQRQDVQKELKLEKEDVDKVRKSADEAVEKALKSGLSEKQFTRLKQLQLQLRGSTAFADAKIQKELKFTEEQKEQIKTIQKDAQEGMQEARELFQDGKFQEGQKKMQEVQKESTVKMTKVLTPDQKKTWKKMTGPEFKFEQPGGRRRARQDN